MGTCVFCRIISGKLPADFVYKDNEIAIFPSINPSAPVHLIAIPTEHVENLDELSDTVLLKIRDKLMELVKEKKLDSKGYRIVTNGGVAKAVPHLHFHLLGEVSVNREV